MWSICVFYGISIIIYIYYYKQQADNQILMIIMSLNLIIFIFIFVHKPYISSFISFLIKNTRSSLKIFFFNSWYQHNIDTYQRLWLKVFKSTEKNASYILTMIIFNVKFFGISYNLDGICLLYIFLYYVDFIIVLLFITYFINNYKCC